MCSPNKVVAKQMLEQGLLLGQGLGKEVKGVKRFDSPKPYTDNRCLGLFL